MFKSGRKINHNLPETAALKSARKYRAKCAAQRKELERLKQETLPKIQTALETAISELETGGDALQTIRLILSFLNSDLDYDELAQAQTLEHPSPIDSPMYLSGIDQIHSSQYVVGAGPSTSSMPYFGFDYAVSSHLG